MPFIGIGLTVLKINNIGQSAAKLVTVSSTDSKSFFKAQVSSDTETGAS